MSHKWKRIEEYDRAKVKNLKSKYAFFDSPVNKTIIQSVSKRAGGGVLGKACEQIKRDWCIQTGLIEYAYNLDKPEIEQLIKDGFDKCGKSYKKRRAR